MVIGGGVWSAYPHLAEFMPWLKGTTLEPRVSSLSSDYDRGDCR